MQLTGKQLRKETLNRQHVVREKKEKPEKFDRALHWYHMRSRV